MANNNPRKPPDAVVTTPVGKPMDAPPRPRPRSRSPKNQETSAVKNVNVSKAVKPNLIIAKSTISKPLSKTVLARKPGLVKKTKNSLKERENIRKITLADGSTCFVASKPLCRPLMKPQPVRKELFLSPDKIIVESNYDSEKEKDDEDSDSDEPKKEIFVRAEAYPAKNIIPPPLSGFPRIQKRTAPPKAIEDSQPPAKMAKMNDSLTTKPVLENASAAKPSKPTSSFSSMQLTLPSIADVKSKRRPIPRIKLPVQHAYLGCYKHPDTQKMLCKIFDQFVPEDDILLDTAVRHLDDIPYATGLFNGHTPYDMEVRWYLWTSNEDCNRFIRNRIREANIANQEELIAKHLPLSAGERNILTARNSTEPATKEAFKELLERNQDVFHWSRRAENLLNYWNTLKENRELADQRPAVDFSEFERDFDFIAQMQEDEFSDADIGLLPRDTTISKAHSARATHVLTESTDNAGFRSDVMQPTVLARLIGAHKCFNIVKPSVVIGRNTSNTSCDIDLFDEGPLRTGERICCYLYLQDGQWMIYNNGGSTIFADSEYLERKNSMALKNGAILEIGIFRLRFLLNKKMDNVVKSSVSDGLATSMDTNNEPITIS